jgi:hypothetical protein
VELYNEELNAKLTEIWTNLESFIIFVHLGWKIELHLCLNIYFIVKWKINKDLLLRINKDCNNLQK